MLEALRDPLWQFVGALLAICAIAAGFLLYHLQRKRKRLVVQTLTKVPLVAFGQEGIAGLQVTYNGRSVENAAVFMIDVQSAGNIPILPSDYEFPISFDFGDSALVLNAEIIETTPKDLPVVASSEKSKATISNHLLNPGDRFRLRILVENPGGELRPSARIAGVRKLESPRSISIAGPIIAIVGFLLFIAMFFSPSPKSNTLSEIRPDEIPFIIVGGIGTVLWLIGNSLTLITLIRRRKFSDRSDA